MRLPNALSVAPANEAVYLMGGIPLLFLLGFVLLLVFGKRMKGGAAIALGVSGLALALVANGFLNSRGEAASVEWFKIGDYALTISIRQDGHSYLMVALVVAITFLVHIFSLAYIEKDPMRHRYWAYLSLFSAAMTGLVLSNNLLLVFVCWELVGVASWFLIGFWFKKPEAAKASQKAFIVNRIADAGFIMALMLIWREYGDFDFPYRLAPNASSLTHFLIGLGLFVGAIGKSAQFPFQVWLPDAMAGPTPVSSLIHAATMVAAGVYLLLSVEPIFVPEMKLVIASIGAFTALIAAISALTQTDIKRVLAYSTVSQLGFMVMGIGVGASNFAFLHLIAHAFFKCGLFLVAGAVIHGIHKAQDQEHLHFDAQDMRFMGGLRRRMPLVFACWIFFAASLAGLPLFSGFLSKDGIVIGAMDFASKNGSWAWLIPGAAIMTSLLTAFYITRQGVLVFLGRNRAQGAGAKDSFFAALPKTDLRMLIPLMILALASTWLILSPKDPIHLPYLKLPTENFPLLPWALTGLAVIGIVFAVFLYRKGPLPSRVNGFLFDLSYKHFFLDDFYTRWLVKPFLALTRLLALFDHYVIDGLVRLVAGLILRKGHRPSLSTAAEWADHHLVDPVVDEVIQPHEKHSLSRASAWLDQKFIDRLVNGFAGTVMRAGKRVGQLQSGKLQLYILYTMLGLLVLLLALIYIFTV
jgi:NADH-quinone oxidoreductase subunit L